MGNERTKEQNKGRFEEEFAGIKKPPSFILTPEVLAAQATDDIVRENIRTDRVVFKFPEGVNNIDIIDRCRMLFSSTDFNLCYTTVMAMLEAKPVQVYLINYGSEDLELFTEFQVTNREVDLKMLPVLNEYPIIVNWLIEFIVANELKKYPVPRIEQPTEALRRRRRQSWSKQNR